MKFNLFSFSLIVTSIVQLFQAGSGSSISRKLHQVTITAGHALESSSFKINGRDAFIGKGSRVIVLDETHHSVGHYSDAVYVQVITNSDDSVLAASSGCKGWVMADKIKDFKRTLIAARKSLQA